MRHRKGVAVVALVAMLGCAGSNPAPPEWSPTSKEAGAWIYGHWIMITTRSGKRISGELIAVGFAGEQVPEHVFVGRRDGLVAVARADVRLISLVEYEPETSGGAAMTTLGTISTLSHGFFLILTVPGWLLFGGIPTNLDSQKGVEEHKVLYWEDDRIRKFARFPQGLPARLRKGLEVNVP